MNDKFLFQKCFLACMLKFPLFAHVCSLMVCAYTLQMKDKVKELEVKLVSAEAEKETLNKVM